MRIEDLEKLKADRSVVTRFIEDLGISDCFVVRMCLEPDKISMDVVAKDSDGKGLTVYQYGRWNPVYHSLRIPIVDVSKALDE